MADSCIRLLPDYATKPNMGMALEKVGIKRFKQFRRDFSGRRTLTHQAAYIDLEGENGAHMSRLAVLMRDRKDENIQIDSDLLMKILLSHEKATSAYWECTWTSEHLLENEQEIYINCQIEGVVLAAARRTAKTRKIKKEDWYMTLEVPYANVCPCAAAMCKEEEYGVPHMQRAMARVTLRVDPTADLEELQTTVVARVISVVDLVPIPVMKRPQELEWCQRADETQLFVEDASRVIGDQIKDLADDWVVVCTHYESIHDHDVVGVCRKGKKLV